MIVTESGLFCSEDRFPGMIGSKLPLKILKVPYQVKIGSKKTLYFYRLRLKL